MDTETDMADTTTGVATDIGIRTLGLAQPFGILTLHYDFLFLASANRGTIL